MNTKTDTCCSPLHTETSDGTYDLAVIGAGSAGFSAAITAAEQGAQVAVIGYGTIGGTCVNVGCVPSKNLIRAAEAVHRSKSADRFSGIRGDAQMFNWGDLRRQKDGLVKDLRQAKYIDVLPAYNNITYIEGQAKLQNGGVLVNGNLLKAPKIIVATGSSPTVPTIKGIEDVAYLTSTTTFELAELPASILIIGGGYIGVEIAQMLSRLGVMVTIVCRSRLVPHTEPEISSALAEILSDEGIIVRLGLTYDRIWETKEGAYLAVESKGSEEVLTAEKVLITAGRSPNTKDLGLAELDVEISVAGGIKIDQHLRTTNPNVFAAGDVTGRDMYVYMAAYGAKLAAKNALNGTTPIAYDATAMPAVTFSDPQVATVGLTERQAIAKGYDTKTSVLTLDHVPRALAALDTKGLIKLVADRETDILLGAHILAPEAGDSIQTAVMAIKCGMTTVDLGSTIFPYLTMVEGLKLAAQTFDKDVSKLSCCAG